MQLSHSTFCPRTNRPAARHWQSQWHPAWWHAVLACLLVAVAAASRGAWAEESVAKKSAAGDIQRLIGDLGSHDYRTREAATRQLISAGATAVDPVVQAAQSEDLEVSSRAVRVLEALMDAGDGATQDRIGEALKMLAGRESTSASSLASDVLALYQFTLNDRAIEQLRQLGALVVPSDEVPFMDPGFVQITLADDWKGKSADLKLLKQVRNLQWLRVINVPLADTDLDCFAELSKLQQVDLYGSGVSAEATQKLSAALPNSQIDRRNGALLGVSGLPNMPTCTINDVRPGTAAEAAGIRVNDDIVGFDGKPVHSFEEFTALVSAKKGGDHITLQVQREDQTLTKEVTLGRWTADVSTSSRFTPRVLVQPVPLPNPPAVPDKPATK